MKKRLWISFAFSMAGGAFTYTYHVLGHTSDWTGFLLIFGITCFCISYDGMAIHALDEEGRLKK